MFISEAVEKNSLSITCEKVGSHIIDGKTPFQWKIHLHFGKKVHTFDFQCGAGHVSRKIPAMRGYGRTEYTLQEVPYHELKEIIRKARNDYDYLTRLYVPTKPTIETALYCLIQDANCYQCAPTWEAFASELGLNVDSIKDKKTFEACQETWAKLKLFFGARILAELQECEEG